MSIVAGLLAKPLIDLLEKELIAYEPMLQQFLVKEFEMLLQRLFDWINEKKDVQNAAH